MTKFPYSNQAVKIVLATVIAAGPFASGASFASIPAVHAAVSENDTAEMAEKFYNHFYDGANAQNLVHAQVGENSNINWHYPEEIKGDSTKEEAYRGIISSITNTTFTGYSEAGDLEEALHDFREGEQKQNFEEIFGSEEVIEDFIDLFREIEKVVNNKSNLISFASKSYDEAVEGIVNEAISQGDLHELDGQLNDGLGVGITGFIELLGDINAEIDEDAKARSELVSTAVQNREFEISNIESIKEGETVQPEFRVNAGGFSVNAAKSFNWYLIDERGNKTNIYSKGDQGEIEFTASSEGVYEIAATLDRLSESDAEIEVARTILDVEANSDSQEEEGDSDTPADDNQNDQEEDQEDNTTVPSDGLYDDEQSTDADGVTHIIRRVDADKLAAELENTENVELMRFKVEKQAAERGELRLSPQVLDVIRGKNPHAEIEVQSEEGSVRLSAEELNDERLRSELELADEEDVEVSISINTSSDDNEVIKTNNLNTKSSIVEFNANVHSDNRKVPLTRFNRHVERSITGDEDLDETHAVVLRLDEQGSGFTAAPTIVHENKASFKSQSFSKYVIVENNVEFDDVPADYWAKHYFDKLGSRFIFQGRDDNTVAPGEEMRRAQFAALLTRALGLSAEGEYDGEFTDVNADDWFTDEIQAAIEQGIIQGRQDNTFDPNESVTRQQAAAMLSRALDITGFDEENLDEQKSIAFFEDKARIGDWAKEDVERLVKAGIISGREDGTVFDPKTGTTRAQMAKMLDEYLKFVNFSN
ncbi:S-layer homology domain-containing protein [Alteribacillus sp. YIM 98480]|uniref:S-layer homology domain-containing protein n=1 Tax=Alteribacillus sp. YIM 98480 TaxID=2606599 RepID=UPI00131DDC08|nr:S-layer homology domain-containing protein [Alteribacillus sp. YIM 98480]